ncbi:uncharacterized protein LOC121858452 [Homarus americanus]|uniref:uncharacterized protein LOC121858452 n=1 Tax=Homarus americanus TaxID=6706 RepID=UPI001C44737C|nr:uncharacterized protein LOC121858452 [Homarus americanus]
MPFARVMPQSEVTPSPTSRRCGSAEVLQSITCVVLSLLSLAAVVVPVTRCYWYDNLLDLWLVIHGVSSLGALVGILAWRAKLAHGRLLDGPLILAVTLLVINFIWLVLGNVAVAGAYLACQSSSASNIYVQECNYPFLHFALAVVVVFDVFYAFFFLALSIAACITKNKTEELNLEDNTYKFPYCCLPGRTYRLSWQEWVGVICVVLYVLLAIASIVMGSLYLRPCNDLEWISIWLIVFGTVMLVTVMKVCWYLIFPKWIAISWPPASIVIFTPVVALIIFQFAWIGVGNVWLVERRSFCPGDSCNISLHIFSLAVIVLLDLPFLVLVYVATIFVVLMLILLLVTSCYYCCKKVKNDTGGSNNNDKKVKNNDTSSDSSSDDEEKKTE